jgi:hypothetical protein
LTSIRIDRQQQWSVRPVHDGHGPRLGEANV